MQICLFQSPQSNFDKIKVLLELIDWIFVYKAKNRKSFCIHDYQCSLWIFVVCVRRNFGLCALFWKWLVFVNLVKTKKMSSPKIGMVFLKPKLHEDQQKKKIFTQNWSGFCARKVYCTVQKHVCATIRLCAVNLCVCAVYETCVRAHTRTV